MRGKRTDLPGTTGISLGLANGMITLPFDDVVDECRAAVLLANEQGVSLTFAEVGREGLRMVLPHLRRRFNGGKPIYFEPGFRLPRGGAAKRRRKGGRR